MNVRQCNSLAITHVDPIMASANWRAMDTAFIRRASLEHNASHPPST